MGRYVSRPSGDKERSLSNVESLCKQGSFENVCNELIDALLEEHVQEATYTTYYRPKFDNIEDIHKSWEAKIKEAIIEQVKKRRKRIKVVRYHN